MHQLYYSQKIPLPLEQCWDFFASPNNLEILTPPFLDFKSNHDSEQTMYAGQIIIHSITPFWMTKLRWVTEITHVDPAHYFIDEQRVGPYKFWHHEHRFKSIENGTEVIDKIHYQLPFGFLGEIVHQLKIKADLAAIFSYRKKKLEELFGVFTYL